MEEEFLKAYDCYADKIYKHCYYRLHNSERAEEVMQEAFMKTWKSLMENHQIDNLKAFLYRTANNLIIDEYRKIKESSLETMMEAGFQPSTPDKSLEISDRLEYQKVMKVLKSVAEPYRTAVILRYSDGFSPRQISVMIGESCNVVSVRIHRGLKLLKQVLKSKNTFHSASLLLYFLDIISFGL